MDRHPGAERNALADVAADADHGQIVPAGLPYIRTSADRDRSTSAMVLRTLASRPTVASKKRMESLTTAPSSTLTPGDSTRPDHASLDRASSVDERARATRAWGPMRAGCRSRMSRWERFVRISQDWRSIAGMLPRSAMLVRQYSARVLV